MKWNKWVIFSFAVGQFGWSLASFGVGNLLNYFYMPPETGNTAIFPQFISPHYVLGIFTWIGLISFSGRFIDGFWDTYIAGHSDNANYKIGKRKAYMIAGIVPFAASAFLIFYPISTDHSINTIWLIVNTAVFYLSMTLYVVPFTALMSELTDNEKGRLLLSTYISITWALGTVVGNMAYALKDYLEQYCNSLTAFQWTMAIFVTIAFIAMLFPILFINEKIHCIQSENKHKTTFSQSIKKAFGNESFRNFVLSDLLYWVAVSMISLGMVYYVKVLLQLETKYVSYVFLGIYALSFALYIPTNIIAFKLGKRLTQKISFGLTIVVYLLISILGKFDWIAPIAQITLIGLLVSFPLATFGIIPNAIVGDIIEAQAAASGERNAALFYAIRSFLMKTGISLANLIFPSLILLGNSPENDLGIRITAVFSAFILILGLYFFRKV